MSICQNCGGIGGAHWPGCGTSRNVPQDGRAQDAAEVDRLRAGIRALRAEVAPLTTVAAAWIDTRLDQLLVDDPTHQGGITVGGVPAEQRADVEALAKEITRLHWDLIPDDAPAQLIAAAGRASALAAVRALSTEAGTQ